MAITTLNQIVQNLSEIADKHLQIHAFKFGDPHEFYSSGTADCCEMWVRVNTNLVTRNTSTFSFTMWLLDAVRRGERNEAEVQSDMDLIARDVRAQLALDDYDWASSLTDSATVNFVTEHSPYKWSGVFFDFTVKLMTPADTCIIPFSSTPTIYPLT